MCHRQITRNVLEAGYAGSTLNAIPRRARRLPGQLKALADACGGRYGERRNAERFVVENHEPSANAAGKAGIRDHHHVSICGKRHSRIMEINLAIRSQRIGERETDFPLVRPGAEAIRFAVEDLPVTGMQVWLEVGNEQLSVDRIRQLYDSADYPLPRRSP